MTRKELEEHRKKFRVSLAQKIKAEPQRYKVCRICCSIIHKPARVCLVCGGYRWETRAAGIIAVADKAATSPFPFTLGYAPPETRLNKTNAMPALGWFVHERWNVDARAADEESGHEPICGIEVKPPAKSGN